MSEEQDIQEENRFKELIARQELEYESTQRHRAVLEELWRARAGVEERMATAWERIATALEGLASHAGDGKGGERE